MPDPVATTIYAAQLTNQHEGYPLWEPDPHNEPPVEIADVGYIEKGAWVRLFNSSKSLDDRSNKFGVPAGYQPLDIGEIQERAPLPANVPIQSESVVQRKGDVTVSGGMATLAGGGFTFECSKEQGAVLLLGDDAERRDALRKEDFIHYILDHHASWLTFANSARKRGIALNDLVLVTGCDKTSAWACAAFSSQSSQAGVSFNVGQMGIAQGGVSLLWTWKNCSSVVTRSGPSRPLPLGLVASSLEAPTPPINTPILSNDGGASLMEVASGSHDVVMAEEHVKRVASWGLPARDQCVFLRGYKMCDRRTWTERLRRIGLKEKLPYDGFDYVPQKKKRKSKDFDRLSSFGRHDAPPDPSGSPKGPPPPRGEGTGNSGPSNSGSAEQNQEKGGSSSSSNGSNVESESLDDENMDLCVQLNYDKEPTPLDVILDYILENSTAGLALVHDDDLIGLLKNMKRVTAFEDWIREVKPKIFVHENQVGMLETTYQVWLSDKTGSTRSINISLSEQQNAHSSGPQYMTHQQFTDVRPPIQNGHKWVLGGPAAVMEGPRLRRGGAKERGNHIKGETIAPSNLRSKVTLIGKGGCWTCRLRRKKCDETRENGSCQTCLRLKIDCLGWGVRRPDWMRDKTQVEAYKAGIKRQLSSRGMIRGQPRAPVTAFGPNTSPARRREGNNRRSLPSATGSSDEGEDYSFEQGSSADASPSYPSIQMPQLTPNVSTTISSLGLQLYPSSSGPDTPPMLPPQYETSSPYVMEYDAPILPFSVPSQSYYEPNPQSQQPSSASSNETREHYVFYYFRRVRQIQFLFAGPDVTSIFHDLVVREPVGVVTNAICALAALHKNQMRVVEGLEDPKAENSLHSVAQQFYDQAWWQLLDSRQRHARYREQDAIAAIHLVSYWLFCGGGGDWQSPLEVASDWLARNPLNSSANPHLQWQQLSASAKFAAQMTMWLDIISAVNMLRVPRFMDLYRRLFGVDQSYWAKSSYGGHVPDLQMDAVTGCPDGVMYALAETANLAHWKAQQQQNRCLSIGELVRRSDEIEQQLRGTWIDASPEVFPHLLDYGDDLNVVRLSKSSSGSSHPSAAPLRTDLVGSTAAVSIHEPTIGAETRRLVSNVFCQAAVLYLQSVVNDHNPVVPEIVEGVDATMKALYKLSLSKIDCGLVFPICLAGCLTDSPEVREFFRQRLDARDMTFGSIAETRRLMEVVWRKRDSQGGTVDWRNIMSDIGTNLLVI